MRRLSNTTSKLGALAQAGTRTVVRLGSYIADEFRQTIDTVRWRQAANWTDRFGAVSWRRTGALAALPLALAGGLYALHLATRADAYPPPDPTVQEIAARREALIEAPRAPPASLIEANKSAETR